MSRKLYKRKLNVKAFWIFIQWRIRRAIAFDSVNMDCIENVFASTRTSFAAQISRKFHFGIYVLILDDKWNKRNAYEEAKQNMAQKINK